jgi:diguanylate cyclase (GGDEF)-like protein
VVSVVVTMTAFGLAALAEGMPGATLLRTCAFLLVTAATSAVAAWQLERQARRSFLEGRLLAELADHDALTGTKNRRVLDEHLSRLWHQGVRDGRRLAILLIDVDFFKAYNDRHGHQAGDVALQRLARTVQAQLHRPLDLLARYGGEEFAALLYDVGAPEAVEIAERIRAAVGAQQMPQQEAGEACFLTVSIGVAAVQPLTERAPPGALQLADEALYTAKIRGRNNVHLATDAAYRQLETGVFEQHASAG